MNNLFRIITLTLMFSVQLIFAQVNSQNLWNDVDEVQIVTTGQRYIIPQEYRTIKLDVAGMHNFLSEAPLEFTDETRSKLAIIFFKRHFIRWILIIT